MSSFRRRLMMSVKKQDEYTELKYLRSTGTQYIDTDFKPNNDTRIIVRAKPINLSTAFFWGARENVYKNSFCAVLESVPNKNISYFRIDYFACNDTSRLKEVTEINNDIHYFEIDKGKIYFDNIQYKHQYESRKFQCNYNLVLFGVNTLNKITKSAVYIYDCKIYDNDVLIRDMIPVLDKNGVACMYDKVNKKFYYNQGTGEFLYQEKENYTELEYLETTGTQYINTEIKTKQSLRVEYTFSGKAQGKLHFGARKNTGEDGLAYGFTNGVSCYCSFGGSSKYYSCNVNTVDGSKHTVALSNEIFTIDDISQTQPERATLKNFYDIYLFTWNNANTPDTRGFVGKAYDFRIYDRDVLIQHLVPALDSNNIPCMYDKVNSKFYYNSGTGDFLYVEKES